MKSATGTLQLYFATRGRNTATDSGVQWSYCNSDHWLVILARRYRVLKSYQNMQDGAVTSDWYWLVKIKSIAGNAINQNKNWKKHDQCSWCGDPRPRGLTSADLINEAAECRHGGSASAPQQGWDNGKYFDLQPRWGTFLVKICLPGYGNNISFLWCSQFLLCTSTTGNVI